MNKEERYSLYEYHSTKTNKELRKIFDNSNWNYNIQLFRTCEEIINDLKEENKQLKEQLEKLSKLDDTDFWLAYNKCIVDLLDENKQLKEEKQNVINYIVKELIEINKHQYAKGSRRLKKILELLGDSNE